jgi:CheY-like chemotaxis protein/Tfp pilus assembly protein PilZ
MAGRGVSSAGSRRRFLLVVDSDIRRLIQTSTLLQRFQYSIWTAKSGEVAIEMATTAVPALIITAQYLNDMPGLQFIQQLKQIDCTQAVPVIVLSQNTDAADERACLAAGAVTCLTPPVKTENLYRVIQVAVEPMPRMNIRIKTSLSVTINSETVRCREGECATVLSEHGVYVRTPDPYPLNTRLPIQIHLAGRAISADAVVIYSDPTGDVHQEPGMGLQFEQISSEDQERIRKFIRHEIIKGI